MYAYKVEKHHYSGFSSGVRDKMVVRSGGAVMTNAGFYQPGKHRVCASRLLECEAREWVEFYSDKD